MEFVERSDELAELACALSAAQGEIEAADKDGLNRHTEARYSTLTAVWGAIRAPLAKNGLSVLQWPIASDPGTISVKTVLLHASGQYVSGVITIACLEVKGLSAAQSYGLALSYARRYGITALVGVCSDDNDAEARDGQQQGQRQAQPPRTTQQARTTPAGSQQGESAQPAARHAGSAEKSDAKIHEDAVNHARQEYFKAAEEVGIERTFIRDQKHIRQIVGIVIPKFADVKTSDFGVMHWNQLTVALLDHAHNPETDTLPGQIIVEKG